MTMSEEIIKALQENIDNLEGTDIRDHEVYDVLEGLSDMIIDLCYSIKEIFIKIKEKEEKVEKVEVGRSNDEKKRMFS